MVSFASRRALVHLHFSGLPIDLWVVVLEPGITEDHVLPSEARDSEKRPFGVGFVTENYVYHFRDLICLVGGAVHVVHQYGARDAPGVNAFHSDEVSIYEVACSSGVQKCLDRIHVMTWQKQLSHYLYFFSFIFLFFYLRLTTQREVWESVTSQASHSHGHMTGSHSITSHDITMMSHIIGMGK